MSEFSPIVPEPSAYSLPYWQNARQHHLSLLRCDSCNRWINYLKLHCPNCGSRDLSWQSCSGKGKVYSFSIVYRPATPALKHRVPYALAIVELSEGIKVMSHVINCPVEQVSIGMDVEVVFDDVDEQRAVPYFQPLGSAKEGVE